MWAPYSERRHRHAVLFHALVCASAALNVRAADVATAVAYIQAKNHEDFPNVGGYVRFSQQVTASGLSDVTVDVSQLSLSGMPAGVHGFHIHQFGDSAVQCDENGGNCATMVGGHFVPVCEMRRDRRADECQVGQPCQLTCGNTASGRSCKCNEIHGLPPSGKRMVGDMGNLECNAQGACKICFNGETGASCSASRNLGQEKLSLFEDMNSIVGRALAIHEFMDNVTKGITSRGLGDAGPAIAYGTVGIINPGASNVQKAKSPSFPDPDKAVCIFRPNIGGNMNDNGLEGKAIISIDGAKKLTGDKDYCTMRAELKGLSAGTRSFHFHDYGDLRYSIDGSASTIGDIFSTGKLNVKSWDVNPDDTSGVAIFETQCTLGAVSELIGRSLTVHSGPSADSSTIAMAVCGIANPSSCFHDTEKPGLRCGSAQAPVDDPGKSKVDAASTNRPWTLASLVFASAAAFAWL